MANKNSRRQADGGTAGIRKIVDKHVSDIEGPYSEKQLNALLESLKKKDRLKIVSAALRGHFDAEALKPYQAELIKMQSHLEATGRKAIVLFDGRDASGKGGTIRRVTRYMNEKHYRVVALGKPNDQQRTELHMKRYIEQFPRAGEIVFFDRSWYNRAMVEPVMKFCTRGQYREFLRKVNDYEDSFVSDKKTTLLKIYFSVSKLEQELRFNRRLHDPLRQWKLSEVDLQAQEMWEDFTEMKYRLLQKSHTKKNPWYVIRSDDKQLARLETIKLILSKIPYRGRSRSLDMHPNSGVIITGDKEMARMEKHRRKHGHFES
jgi:polyphosphate kinase 2